MKKQPGCVHHYTSHLSHSLFSLARLLTFLDFLPEEHFDMFTFFSSARTTFLLCIFHVFFVYPILSLHCYVQGNNSTQTQTGLCKKHSFNVYTQKWQYTNLACREGQRTWKKRAFTGKTSRIKLTRKTKTNPLNTETHRETRQRHTAAQGGDNEGQVNAIRRCHRRQR